MKLQIVCNPKKTFRQYALQETHEEGEIIKHGDFQTEKAARRAADRLLTTNIAPYVVWESP